MLFSAHPNIHYRTIILSRLLHTSIENILVIDGDIPRFRIILNYTQRWQESLHRLR